MKLQLIQNIIDIIRGKKYLKLVTNKKYAITKKRSENFSQNYKPDINFLVFWVGTKCTLKCKRCGNLVPYMKPVSYDADKIIDDLKFLSKHVNIKSLQIQGGEPFTHPYIVKILDEISKLKIKKITIATNGTLVLKQDVLNVLKTNHNLSIRISNYDCCKDQQEKFCKQLKDNKITYKFYSFMYGDNTWFDTGGINENKADNIAVQKIYEKCDDKICHTLADGNLTLCGKIPAIKEIYNFNEFHADDEVDIRKIRASFNCFKGLLLKKHIKKFLDNKKNYKEQCRYCNISNVRYPAAEQLTREELKEAKTIISCHK